MPFEFQCDALYISSETMTIKWTIYEDLTLHSDVNLKVDQYDVYVKRVATDMQHHMFSLHTIKCTESICENINKIYIIALLFIVTEAQMSMLMESSDSPFSLHTNQHILHSVVWHIC